MNLYEVLGITKDATKKEIQDAYRNLSKIHHPDKNGDAEKFHKICEAYRILMDDQKRSVYDETGCVDDTDLNTFIQTNLITAATTWIQGVMLDKMKLSFEEFFAANHQNNVTKAKAELTKVQGEIRRLNKLKKNEGPEFFTLALNNAEKLVKEKEFHIKGGLEKLKLLGEAFNEFDFSNMAAVNDFVNFSATTYSGSNRMFTFDCTTS